MVDPNQEQAEPTLPLELDAGKSHDQYVVVARRYRPQSFDELIGQEHVARALSGAIASNRVGHAYLFTGARGVGKTSAARILAKALNCALGPTPTPCNQCDACQSIRDGSDVDVLEIDGASNRGIDEIRQLRQNVSIRPSRARYKIYIIDEVHMLTREAFNALLKTLEEPPEHVKFIFRTTEPSKIPITILSRCQRFDFAGIGQQAIVGRLKQIVAGEHADVDEQALAVLARRASGSMRDSQSLLEQLLAFGGDKVTAADVHAMLGTAGEARLQALADHLTGHDAAAAIAEFDAALTDGVDVGPLLEQLLGYFRDTLMALVGCSPETFLHTSPGDYQRLEASGKQVGLETLLAIMQILDHTLSRLRYSTQARTLAEVALVRIANLEDLGDLADLIAQLRSEQPSSEQGAASPRGGTSSTAAASPKKKEGPPVESPVGQNASRGVAKSLPLTDETVDQVWKEALASLSDLLADNAALAESLALSAPGRLVATFRAKYTSCKAFCERPQQLATLERALAEVAGQPISVEFRTLDDEPDETPAAGRPMSQRQRIDETGAHPLVRRTSELFGARLVRVEEPKS